MKKTFIISIVVAVVFLALGYLLGLSAQPSGSVAGLSQLVKGNDTFKAGWEAAKTRMVESGYVPMDTNIKLQNINGTVKEIKNGAITLTVRPLEPLADPSLNERTVKIDSKTQIFKLEPKDQKVYQQELADFNKKIKAQVKPGQVPSVSNSALPPIAFIQKLVSLADIKAGDKIDVTSGNDEDIKSAKTFKASNIIISANPMAGEVIPPPAK
jgi:hypothetical protein